MAMPGSNGDTQLLIDDAVSTQPSRARGMSNNETNDSLSCDFPSAERKPGGGYEGYVGANVIAKASLFSRAGAFQCKARLGRMTFYCV